jgi:hypothetical protein
VGIPVQIPILEEALETITKVTMSITLTYIITEGNLLDLMAVIL